MEDGYHQGIQVAPHAGLHPVNPDNSQKEVYVTPDLSHFSTVVFAQQSLKIPKICGLRRTTFWLAAILGAIVVVLLVAGGIMGDFLVKNRSAISSNNATGTASSNQHTLTTIVVVSSVTTTVPTTIFVQPSATTSSDISATQTSFTDCPSSNGTIFTAQTNLTGKPAAPGTSFRKYCNTHLVSNNDMNFIALNDFDNCITACAQVNLYTLSSDTNCTGVSFAPRTSGCWLHAGPEPIGVGGAQGEDSAIVVAVQ